MKFDTLKRHAQLLVFSTGLALTSIPATHAQDSVAELVLDHCALEIEDHCSTVSVGRGRVAACLYAHSDKLSRECAISMRVGMHQFRMILAAISYVRHQCHGDLDKFCSGVEVGGGRVYRCLSYNKDKLSTTCSTAFTKVSEDLK